jgi:hypothetical protein
LLLAAFTFVFGRIFESRRPQLNLDICRGGTIGMKVLFLRDVANPFFGLTVKSKDGMTPASANSRVLGQARHPGFIDMSPEIRISNAA